MCGGASGWCRLCDVRVAPSRVRTVVTVIIRPVTTMMAPVSTEGMVRMGLTWPGSICCAVGLLLVAVVLLVLAGSRHTGGAMLVRLVALLVSVIALLVSVIAVVSMVRMMHVAA